MVLNSSDFLNLLEQELLATQHITQLLQQEHEQITEQELDNFEALQAQKKIALTALRQQAQLRIQWLEQHNLPLSASALAHFNDQNTQYLHDLWQQLENSYQQNQQLSAKLGELVLILRHRAEQRIKILYGRTDESALYDQYGQAGNNGRGRQSIQA